MSKNTPEKTLIGFLECWKKGSFKKMINFIQISWKSEQENSKQKLEAFFDHKKLIYYEIKSRKKVDKAVMDMLEKYGFNRKEVEKAFVDIEVFIKYNYSGKIFTKRIIPRISCEAGPYKPDEKGMWGINPTSALKEF